MLRNPWGWPWRRLYDVPEPHHHQREDLDGVPWIQLVMAGHGRLTWAIYGEQPAVVLRQLYQQLWFSKNMTFSHRGSWSNGETSPVATAEPLG